MAAPALAARDIVYPVGSLYVEWHPATVLDKREVAAAVFYLGNIYDSCFHILNSITIFFILVAKLRISL